MSKREQEIIAAAAKVFKEKGYHAATTRDIAAEVGIQQATLYYYISSKEELLYLVVREPIVRLFSQQSHRHLAGQDPRIPRALPAFMGGDSPARDCRRGVTCRPGCDSDGLHDHGDV